MAKEKEPTKPDARDTGILSTLMGFRDLMKDATGIGNKSYGEDTTHNGKSDAMRHIIFNAKITAGTGTRSIPWLLDKLHEYGETALQQPQAERDMDLANGVIGRRIGNMNLSDAQMINEAKKAIDSGEAVTIKGTPKYKEYAEGGSVSLQDLDEKYNQPEYYRDKDGVLTVVIKGGRDPDLPEMPTEETSTRDVPEMSLADKLENLSIGAGKGIENQLAGIAQMVEHPIETGKGMVKGVTAVIKDPSLIKQALADVASKATESPMGLGEVIGENINPVGLAKRLAGIGNPVIKELTVYHGTPHRFPATERNPLGEFDASKIGTGEGAQAYGHGIYVAQVPEVAKDYQFMEQNWFDTDEATYKGKSIQHWYDQAQAEQDRAHRLNNKAMIDNANAKLAFWEEIMTHNHPEKVISTMKSPDYGWDKAKEFAESIDPTKFKGIPEPGSFYTVDLPDEMIDRMLHWDKPLSEQHQSIRTAIQDLPEVKTLNERGKAFDDLTGGEFYKLISDSRTGGFRDASSGLKDIGIPGIQYFDAGSRDVGEGTRNFVIFPGEEKKMTILERKAEGGLVSQPAATSYDPDLVNSIADQLHQEMSSYGL